MALFLFLVKSYTVHTVPSIRILLIPAVRLQEAAPRVRVPPLRRRRPPPGASGGRGQETKIMHFIPQLQNIESHNTRGRDVLVKIQ